MSSRLRKLTGTVLLLVWIIVYSLAAMVIGSRLLNGTNLFWQLVVYLVTGFAWLPPAMWIVSWMHRGDTSREA